MTLVAMPSSVLLTVLIGYLADRVKPVYLIAPGFFGRACVSFLFKTVVDPKGIYSFTLVTFLIATSIMQVVALESLLMKNLPSDARGAFTILVTFFMGVASLLYNIVGGPVFDALGPSSPFVLISAFDITLFAFAMFLGIGGYLTIDSDVAKE